MARKIEIDWVVVRVNTLRRAVALTATGLVAAALLAFGYSRLHLPPEAQARRAIERAEKARSELADRPVSRMWQQELDGAKRQLEGAREAYSDERWDLSLDLARKAGQRFNAILGAGDHQVVGVGQVLTFTGEVSVQRAGKPEWAGAQKGMPVFNGDFVRTGDNGSAEILFADGTLYRVSPSSLLEIHHQTRTTAPGKVKMVVGHINVYTSTQPSTVATDSLEATVERDSRVAVDVRGRKQSAVVAAYSGRAEVRGSAGGQVSLGSRERVTVEADGALRAKGRIPDPPRPRQPADNSVFDLTATRVITLRWELPAPGLESHLQVSRSRRFQQGALDVDAPHRKRSSARLKLVAPGVYSWRVAAVDDSGTESEWSWVRTFQVASADRHMPLEDQTPPRLKVEPARQMGRLFIVEGHTEVGATVSINGEAVDVGTDGHFRKAVEVMQEGWNELVVAAVDPAGNRAERRQRVYVEVY